MVLTPTRRQFFKWFTATKKIMKKNKSIATTNSQFALFLPCNTAAWIVCSVVPLVTTASFMAFGGDGAINIPAVNIAREPLYAAVAVDKPTLALALSVEFPTVGAQYTSASTIDDSYSNATEYLGYYDSESCYNYNDNPKETIPIGFSPADYKRFDRSGPATSRKCSNAFSGNFLNWASSSAIDMLRLALSGGDRYIDTPSLTVLQRAVIPNGDPICMWNSGNFPAKKLSKNGGGNGTYWGAVPAAMTTQADGNDIWIANTLNRIYFGTSNTGGCGNTGAYTLGKSGASSSMGTVVTVTTELPSGPGACAGENQNCSFSGIKEIWYGAKNNNNNKWNVVPASDGIMCSNGVLGDPFSGVAKNCFIRDYSGSWQPPKSNGNLNSDGFFYSRVQACDTNSGKLNDERDYGLCRQYPNGNYKPTGVIQKYSDQLRLAAFGYLLDQSASYDTNGRYGGVLRAPMKYVGQKTFDINGQDNTPAGGNSKAEWNANTGVFILNPDGDTTQTQNISGVINYLNKFGRTGTQGIYKKYDPVGELHYETLRYLQGMPPSPDAIKETTSQMQDGFPFFKTWDDPYGGGRSNTANYSCLKSNIVVIGDTNTHDGNRLPAASDSGNIPDINLWRNIAQKFEANSGGNYTDGQGESRNISNPNPPNGSSPTAPKTSQIIGSSYWAHVNDIRGKKWSEKEKQRPGLRVKTFIFDVDENGAWFKNPTGRRTANQFSIAAKYGGFETDPSNTGSKPYNTYGNPFKNQSGENDNNVWQKSADPGEAATYYLQSSARGVLNAFDDIFSRASTAARSIAGGSSSSQAISTTAGAVIYTAKFDTSNWSGDVVAEPVSISNSNELSLGAAQWSAAERLTTRASPAVNRNIVIGSGSATANPAAKDFTWGTISTTLQADLNKAPPSATADSLGKERLNYLRGDRTKEGNPFRVRTSLLGDIVNSGVVYSGAPSKEYTGTGYAAFRKAYDGRKPAVFVGANDGMLHAFDASNGDELFGYIPSWMGHKLSALSSVSFITEHQNYVDATPVISEAQVAFAGTAADWKTVLVSGTGGGGSGVFALDVSNPATFSASNAMWEFTRADDADMGQVIGQPQILKFKTSGDSATASYRWFAVVGSGVNNYVPDHTGLFSTTGNPALFLLALDKAAGQSWALGTNYFKISLPVDTTLSPNHPTGLANFTPIYGSSGEVTNIYMGDFHGKMWKLKFYEDSTNIKSIATDKWNSGNLSFYNKGTSDSPDIFPMYIAQDKDGNIQPITAAPTIFTGPVVKGTDSFYVVFGTGKYLESPDNLNTTKNTVYAIYDNNDFKADKTSGAKAAISGRKRLKSGEVNTTSKIISVENFIWGRATKDNDTSQLSGWYFDLPSTGERLVSKISDLGALTATLNTIIPGSNSNTLGSCSNAPGSSNQYVVNISSGSGKYTESTVGVTGPPIHLIVNPAPENPEISPSDSTGRRIRKKLVKNLSPGQTGISKNSPEITIDEILGRLSWRQINNYQDIKNQSAP